MSRRALLDDKLEAKILTLARAGNFRQTIANAVGISRETLYAWCRTNPEFAGKLLAAEAESEQRAVAKMLRSKDPKWALAWLERRHPKRWSQTALAEAEPEEVGSPEEREAIADLVAKAREEGFREGKASK